MEEKGEERRLRKGAIVSSSPPKRLRLIRSEVVGVAKVANN